MPPEPVLIFDLDGTILRVNSFPRWVLFLIAGRIRHLPRARRLRVSGRVMRLLLRRKLGRIGHEALKHELQGMWQTIAADDGGATAAAFSALLARHVRANLRPLLAEVAAGRDAILATAAAADYAQALARQLGFRWVLATPPRRAAGTQSNSGARKRDAVLEFLARQGWQDRKRVFFTDHIEDLPLMQECDTVFWCGPEAAMPGARSAAPDTQFVFCRNLSADALMPLLA